MDNKMNPFETAFFLGIGLAMKGKEKIEEAAGKFAEETKMSAEEGKEFVKRMVASAEEAKDDFSTKLEENIKKAINSMGLADRKEVENLKARIAVLEEEIKILKGS